MNTEPENPPAFPVATDYSKVNEGMTLLDYMAAQAMVGILSNPASYDEKGNWRNESETIAEIAYDIAKDMLKERAAK